MTGPSPDPAAALGRDASLRFVGNATMLLRLGGLTLLTDPNFVPAGTDVPIGYGLTTRRLRDPAIGWEELPPVDAVLLSHYHGDHFDPLVEASLDRAMPIVTTPQAAGILDEKGFGRALGLETWARHELWSAAGLVRITALPGRHAPGPLEIALPDVMGSLVEVWDGVTADTAPVGDAPALRLYVSGDTLVYEDLREIGTRVGTIDLAILHLGGTRVMGVTVTMDAEQGLELIRMLEPARAAAIHYDDYEAFHSPIEDFVRAVDAAGLRERVRPLVRGETLDLRTLDGEGAAAFSGGTAVRS